MLRLRSMEHKVFVDTNVFLDLLLNRGKHGLKARDFFMKANQEKVHLLTSISCIQTIIYVLEKAKLDDDKIRQSISYLNKIVVLIDTSHEDVNAAIESKIKDLEDAILYYTAISNNCAYMITQNVKDFPVSNEKIRILKPEEF